MSTSTASIQNNFEMPAPKLPARKLATTVEEPALVTSNLKIFPSLHPLSNHYRQKTPVSANLESSETIKKVKLENSEKVVKVSSPEGDFSMSKIPKKIIKDVKGKAMKVLANKKVEQCQPSLTMCDPMLNAMQNIQAQKMITLQRQLALQKDMMMQQQLSQKALQYAAMLRSFNTSQENLVFNLGAQSNGFNMDQSPRMNEISSHLIPNITHLMKVCQQNQDQLSLILQNQYLNQVAIHNGAYSNQF